MKEKVINILRMVGIMNRRKRKLPPNVVVAPVTPKPSCRLPTFHLPTMEKERQGNPK